MSSLSTGHCRRFPGQTPLHPEPRHIRQVPRVAEVQQKSLRQHFPWSFSRSAEQGVRTNLWVTPPLPWPGPEIFLGATLYELLPYSHLCLLYTRLAKTPKSWNKGGDLFVEVQKQLKCPKPELKMPLHRRMHTPKPWRTHWRYWPCSSQNSCTSVMSDTPQAELSRALNIV